MNWEPNLKMIQTSEEQMKGSGGDLVKPRGDQISLLNVKLPPEILGQIFVWAAVREKVHASNPLEQHFAGLPFFPHNFLFVCHHWFDVASNTPELWSFWGNTLWDWEKWFRYSLNSPIDLVLDGDAILYRKRVQELSAPLQDILRDRADQGKIREIHLRGEKTELIAMILSYLIPGGQAAREAGVESIILMSPILPEISNFFAQSHLQRLRYLHVEGRLRTSPWGHLVSQTKSLTTLSLRLTEQSPSPTMTQLLSILVSNPNLEVVQFSEEALPKDVDDARFQTPLRQLKSLDIEGDFHRVFGLLCRLELPGTLDHINLSMTVSTIDGVLQTLGPFMQDNFRRNTRFQGKLEIYASLHDRVEISVGHVGEHPEIHFQSLQDSLPWAKFSLSIINPRPSYSVLKRLSLDLIASTPQEHVVSFKTHLLEPSEDVFAAMPHIEVLSCRGLTFSDGFLLPNPNGPPSDEKHLPSLRFLQLMSVRLGEGGWEPLKQYLARRTSDGSNTISLGLSANTFMPWEDAKDIRDMVKEFHYQVNGYGCPNVNGNKKDYIKFDEENPLDHSLLLTTGSSARSWYSYIART